MRLLQVIYFTLAICTLLIGVHQTWLYGFAASYWLFMFMITFLALFRLDVGKHGIPMIDKYIAEQKAKGNYPGSKVPKQSPKSKTGKAK